MPIWDLKEKNANRTIGLFTKNKTLIHYMYVADRQHWVPMSLKPVDYSSSIEHDGSTNFISYISSPLVYIKFDNSNYVSDLDISLINGFKYFVILENTTNQSINLALGQGRSEKLLPGEKARFQFNSNGFNPVKVSHTIDLLLVNSPEVSNAIGASAAKIRFLEAVALTNQISEDSNANMYLRVAGYLEHAVNGPDMLTEKKVLETDAIVQAERKRLGADGIHYQTKRSVNLCGIANVEPGYISNMLGVSAYDCSLATMAHEVGHNLGLHHVETTGFSLETRYKRGFSAPYGIGITVMGYQGVGSMPYYSSPNIYHPRYLFRMGDEIESDNVRQINEYAPIISAFATATQQ